MISTDVVELDRVIRRSACPLDCPDACSLDVTIEGGRVVRLDGNHVNPVTDGYICRKVHHFPEHMYGPDRLLLPQLRTGPKGTGQYRDCTWDEALSTIADRLGAIKAKFGGAAIVPVCYGGSNGLLTQDAMDARFFRRVGASQIHRNICAAATGRAAAGVYGGMPGVPFPSYQHANLIVLWGMNPSASGIHLVPFIKAARAKGAKLVVVDPRRIPLAAGADLHLPIRPGTDVVLALAVHRWLFANGKADVDFLAEHAAEVDEFSRRAEHWTLDAAAEVTGVPAGDIEKFAEWYAAASPAVIRCGWGPERNRNGGSAVAAIIALPAVAGKFGVPGGGYTMSNSPTWDMKPTAASQSEPSATRVVPLSQIGRYLHEATDPPVKALFVYNCNPLMTLPDQERLRSGMLKEDVFTIVFDQVRTDSALLADVVLPATTFLEHDELSRGYGSLMLHRSPPVVRPTGEARSNVAVFGELVARMGLSRAGDETDPQRLTDMILRSSHRFPDLVERLPVAGSIPPPSGPLPVQFADVFPRTADGKIHLVPAELDREAPAGIYAYQPDPTDAAPEYPLALVSPALAETVSSTFGQLLKGPAAVEINSADAQVRGIAHGSDVRVFNELGEVRCRASVVTTVRPGVAVLAKGLWARHTASGTTSNAVCPDGFTDLGQGACYNDARVEIAAL